MTKSKRKRESFVVRTIPISELGSNFIHNLKHGILSELNAAMDAHLKALSQIHDLIVEKEKSAPNPVEINKLHRPIARLNLIESLTILDSSINSVLHHYQLRVKNIDATKTTDFSKIDEGLKYMMKDLNVPLELDRKRIEMQHFRTLRNQFAHYRDGAFFYSANQESFESFIRNLPGIDIKETFHCYIDGKAGVFTPYGISSVEFINTFHKCAQEFMRMLIEFLFPTEEQKMFEFAK